MPKPLLISLRIAGLYLALAVLWILLSDRAVSLLFEDVPVLFTAAQSIKGLVFVTASAVLILVLVLRVLTKEQTSQDRLAESEARLRRMVDELTRSKAEIDRFSFAVAHDLREPVRQIASYSTLLQRKGGDQLPDEVRDYATYMVEGAQRIDRMLDGFLNRFEQRIAAPFQTVSLNDCLTRALKRLHTDIEATGAVIESQPLPLIYGDGDQLTLLFEAVLSNALKFHRPEEPPIIALWSERDGPEWVIFISDQGLGFPPHQAEAMFEAFTSLNSKALYPGAGMGLSIARAIVERHGGTIAATPLPEQGALFSVRFPVQGTAR